MDHSRPVMYIDVHTHANSANADVLAIRNIRAGWPQAELVDGSPVSYGIHPWDSNLENPLDLLNKVNLFNQLYAIGECGIDKNIKTNLDVQKEVFRTQIELSEKMHIPLIIHCVGAYNEIIELKKIMAPSQPWIVHGFQGHPQLALQLVGSGIFLSFGASILKEGSKSAKALEVMPAGSFFLETDDSGKNIQEMYHQASLLRHENVSFIKDLLYNQFKYLFKVKDGVDQSY